MIGHADALEALSSESFVVVIIGGGITGAGVALDAAVAASAWRSSRRPISRRHLQPFVDARPRRPAGRAWPRLPPSSAVCSTGSE
jgi:hypothetical protein